MMMMMMIVVVVVRIGTYGSSNFNRHTFL